MALMEARWLQYNTNTLEDVSGSLSVKLVPSASGGALTATANGINIDDGSVTNDMLAGNIADSKLAGTYLYADGSRAMTGDLDMGGNRVINLNTSPTSDSEAACKSYVDSRVSTGVSWSYPVFIPEQLDSTADAILGGVAFWLINNLQNNDVINLAKGSNTETYTAGTDFNVGATIADTLNNLAAAINTNSMYFSASTTTNLSSMAPTVLVIYEKDDTAGDLYIWGTIQGATKPKINSNYSSSTGTDLPSSQPSSTNFGNKKATADLIDNETHTVRSTDESYTWDSDAGVWNMISSGAVPDASKTQKGRVQISDGIAVSGGVISIDLSTTSGLELVGTSPYKTLELSDSVAGDGLGISGKVISVNAGDGIVISSDAVAVQVSDIAGNGLVDDGSNNLTLADSVAGDGLTMTSGSGVVNVGAGDGITVSANAVQVNASDLAGSGLDVDGSNNLRISTAAAGDGLVGGGGSPLAVNPGDGITINADAVAVNVSDIAGAGLEADESNNLTFASTAAGDGLSVSNGVFSVNTGNGIQISNDAVALGTLTADWDATGAHILVSSPTLDAHAANKAYVDSKVASVNSRKTYNYTLTATDITNKYIDLPDTPVTASAVVANIAGAPVSYYGDDYQMDGTTQNRLTWDSLGWDGIVEAGDKVQVVYDVSVS